MIVKYLLVRVFRPSRGEPVLICILLLLKHGTRLCAVRFKSALLKLLIVNVYELVMVLFRRKIVSSWHVLRVLVVNVRITILYCVVILPLTCGYTLTCSMSYSPKAFTIWRIGKICNVLAVVSDIVITCLEITNYDM